MAKLALTKASADVTVYVFVQNSSLATGVGLTGLVYNSAGLVCYYVRPLAAGTALTLATQTVTGAHADGGFVEVDATNMPGIYRLDLSDAICAAGVNSVVVMLRGAANMAPVTLEIQLTSINLNDAVRAGMTALPNAAADAAGGLPISDAGALDLDALNTAAVRLTAARAQVLDDWINAGRLDAILDIIAADVVNIDGAAMRGTDSAALASVCTEGRLAELDAANLPADVADVPTVAEFNARTLLAAAYFDPAVDAVANVTLVATTTTNTDMRGTDSAALASVCTEGRLAELDAANIPADLDAVLADTNELQTDDVPGLIAALNDPAAAAIADQVWDEAIADHAGVGSTGEALAGASAPSAATVADAVWDEAAADHVAAGSMGQQLGTDVDAILADTNELQTDDVPGLIAALNDPTAAAIADQVWDEAAADHVAAGSMGQQLGTDVDAILADTNELQTDDVPGLIAALNDPTAAAIADQVWDEAIADHAGVGSTGEALAGASAPSAATVADAVWDEAKADHVAAGSFGEELDDVGGEVWSHVARTLTQSAATIMAALTGTEVTILRGDTLSISFTALGSLSGYVALDFTLKGDKNDGDNSALARIRKNASGVDDGLLRLNGRSVSDATKGSIAIDDADSGDITVTLAASETDDLDVQDDLYYDVQMITATTVDTLTEGEAEVTGDVTRAVE